MPRIWVSNPSWQHTPHLVEALASFFPGEVIWLTSRDYRFQLKLGHGLGICITRRSVPLEMRALGFWWLRELVLRLFWRGERRDFLRDRMHDRLIARRVRTCRPQVLFGSEKSCMASFQAVREYGGYCLLDLAQVHPEALEKQCHRYPFLLTSWGGSQLLEKSRLVKCSEYTLANTILVNSPKIRDSLLAAALVPQKIKEVRLGVDFRYFYPGSRKPNATLRLIYVGHFSEAKGRDFLKNLMAQLTEFPVTLTLVGPGGQEFFQKLNFAAIQYRGMLDSKGVAAQLQSADVFVFPSYHDSWGRAVTEAMACGLPVLASEEAGVGEWVTKASGYVLPLRLTDWIEAIMTLLADAQLRREMGRSAALQVSSCTWYSYQQQIASVFRESGIR